MKKLVTCVVKTNAGTCLTGNGVLWTFCREHPHRLCKFAWNYTRLLAGIHMVGGLTPTAVNHKGSLAYIIGIKCFHSIFVGVHRPLCAMIWVFTFFVYTDLQIFTIFSYIGTFLYRFTNIHNIFKHTFLYSFTNIYNRYLHYLHEFQ